MQPSPDLEAHWTTWNGPALIETNANPSDVWTGFAGETDIIEDRAGQYAPQLADPIPAVLAKHGRYLVGVDADA